MGLGDYWVMELGGFEEAGGFEEVENLEPDQEKKLEGLEGAEERTDQ